MQYTRNIKTESITVFEHHTANKIKLYFTHCFVTYSV